MIRATGGAEILINQISDVVFKADGVQQPIRDLNSENGVVKFYSGATAMSPLDNEITFRIKAPAISSTFAVSTKIGTDATPANPVTNYVEKTFEVKPAFSVGTSQDTIVDNGPFDVFGQIGFENASGYDYMVALEIRNKSTGNVVHELSSVDFPMTNGEFLFEGLTFPSTCQKGMYVIEVTLLDLLNGYIVVASEQKEVEYYKTPVVVEPATITISSLGGTTNATYNVGGTRSRVYGNASVTINGRAMNGNVPASNAEIIVGVKDEAWADPSNGERTTVVTTDEDGYFKGVVVAPPVVGAYSQYVTVSTHHFDMGIAFAKSKSNPNIKATDWKMYFFGWTS